MMSEETTTEQLVETEGQSEDTPTTEYTPPDGWRLLAVGELVMLDDQWVRQDGSVWRSMGTEGPVSEGARYIRRIEPEPVWVCEGRWRTRRGDIRNVTPTPEGDRRKELYPWWDAQWLLTWTANGRYYSDREDSPLDLVEYLGRIEQQPEPVPAVQGGLIRDVTHLLEESGVLDLAKAEQQIEELRSEVSHVQRLLGESRQRVTQLEELVASLRTINEGAEKAVSRAGVVNDSLRLQLAAVKAEVVTQAETSRRLQIELDAAQQVPQAVSDRFEEGWDAGTALAVETIAEWLHAFRGCNSPALALLLLEALPSIMRHLTGLTPED